MSAIEQPPQREVSDNNVDITLLDAKLYKWKYQAQLFQEGVIPIQTHKNILQEIREIYAEEFMFHKMKWEKIHKEREQLK